MKYLSPYIIKAVKKGNVNAVKRYLCLHQNNLPLLNACEQRRREGVLFKGSSTGLNHDGLLHLAIRYNQFDILKLLVENPQININLTNGTLQTPLMLAVTYRKQEAVNILLTSKTINVDAADYNGDTALILASRMGSLEIVKALLEHGADVHHRNLLGYTAHQEAGFFACDEIAGHIVQVLAAKAVLPHPSL